MVFWKKTSIRKSMFAFLILACILGFLYNILQFLFLYITYPTVIDIQISVPMEFDMPAITICDHNGMKPLSVCLSGGFCIPSFFLVEYKPCDILPELCFLIGNEFSRDIKMVAFKSFIENKNFSAEEMMFLRIPLEEFFSCKVISSGEERSCNVEDVLLSSYYSDNEIFNFCYTLNSLWSQPNKKLEKLKITDRVKMEFYVDLSGRGRSPLKDKITDLKFNVPNSPAVQLDIHSNREATSPFISGIGLIGGKKYQIKLWKEETHLLPAPYQTNCTDYLLPWLNRRGVGPLNQIMAIEECKYNISLREFGCVPFSIDYPHNDVVCNYCKDCRDMRLIEEECINMSSSLSQPCLSETYVMKVEEKLVHVEKTLVNNELNYTENFYVPGFGYSCTGRSILTRRNLCILYFRKMNRAIITILFSKKKCQTIEVEIVFEDFEIRQSEYKPKYESVAFLSVIGQYMGIYLGISMLTIYDILEITWKFLRHFQSNYFEKNKRAQKLQKKKVLKKKEGNLIRGTRRRTKVQPFKETY